MQAGGRVVASEVGGRRRHPVEWGSDRPVSLHRLEKTGLIEEALRRPEVRQTYLMAPENSQPTHPQIAATVEPRLSMKDRLLRKAHDNLLAVEIERLLAAENDLENVRRDEE